MLRSFRLAFKRQCPNQLLTTVLLVAMYSQPATCRTLRSASWCLLISDNVAVPCFATNYTVLLLYKN